MNMIELASRSVTLAARVRHSPPPILYHYTSADGVIGILSSKELWATNIEFLNDTNEILEAVRVARNIIENLIDRDTFSHGEKLLMNKMREHAGSAAKRFYVVSFSETSDSLLHWQAYCSGSGGYAIGFPSKHLSGLALEKSWYLAKCIYGATCRIACTSGIFFLRVKHGAGSGADWWTLGPLSDSVELSNNRIRRNDPNGLT